MSRPIASGPGESRDVDKARIAGKRGDRQQFRRGKEKRQRSDDREERERPQVAAEELAASEKQPSASPAMKLMWMPPL